MNRLLKVKKWLVFTLFWVALPAYAETTVDPFQDIAAKYKAANPKPVMPEVARKYKVQADFAAQEKRLDQAIELYGKALEIAPWLPEAHYQLALVFAEKKKYRDATREMLRFLMLAAEAPEARAAQDKIYQWESVLEPEVGKIFKDCAECPEMVEIPAGTFAMGANDGEEDEKPVHSVTVAKSFAIGRTEVTQAQWRAVMGSNPSYFETCADTCPVEQVSWSDTQEYIKKLNAKTGKHYRLPTEAEWEYACRSGGAHEYCGSDIADQVAWHGNNSGGFLMKSPHPVATKKPNAFGLHDMSGNVWEWVEDTYHESYMGAPTDGSAWMSGAMHVLRGGSWGYDPKFSRASARTKFGANFRYMSYGFRLARDLK